MERMHLFLCILLGISSAFVSRAGAEDFTIGQDTPVYQSTANESRVLFTLHPGETVETSPSKNDDFYRIRVNRRGKWRSGFVFKEALDFGIGTEVAARHWGFGVSYMAGTLSQKGKNFTTTDQVQYTMSELKGSSGSPMVMVQWLDEDFWRIGFGQKTTRAKTTATTNVGSSNEMELSLTFWSILLQKAWTPFSIKSIYFGLGAEAAKASAMELQYGATTLKTTSKDYPVYVGGEVFVGFNAFVLSSLSLYGEARAQQVFSQSPGILFLEGGAGLMYWP